MKEKKFQSKTKPTKLKIKAFNPGHRAVSDKAQRKCKPGKETAGEARYEACRYLCLIHFLYMSVARSRK